MREGIRGRRRALEWIADHENTFPDSYLYCEPQSVPMRLEQKDSLRNLPGRRHYELPDD